MRDPSNQIREAVANALAGITWGTDVVAIYDELAVDSASYPRIILLDCIGGDTDNSKCGWAGDWTQTIKVSDSFTSSVTKNRIGDISNEICMRLIQTDPALIIHVPDFNIWNVQGNVVGVQRYSDQTRKYIDQNIRITFSLTEN